MKKLVVLMIFLGMTSMAGASVIISVGGSTDVREITIQPSDTITVGVYNPGSGDLPIDFISYLDFYYVSENRFSVGNDRWGPAVGNGDPAPSFNRYNGAYDNTEIEVSQTWAQGADEVTGDIFLIDLHCEAVGDVLVELYDYRMPGGQELVDTMTIHQGVIPEPTTIALLGLGGLLVRRFRKKTA